MSVILDIRTEREFCQGHLCGALLIETPLPPLNLYKKSQLRKSLDLKLKGFNKNIKIFLYCKKGIRANIAQEMLLNMDFQNVVVLGGVEKGWLSTKLKGKEIGLCFCNE